MVTAGEPNPRVPAGLLIPGTPASLAGVFGALAALQPVAWTDAGLVCCPRAAADDQAGALRDCPVPWTALTVVPGWPDPPARWLSGWYVRSTAHAPAPPGVRELIQVPGDGFGPGGHPTTAMCLAMLARMPAGPAVDVGCGSGLLAQAWARLGRGPVMGVDLDGRAITQAAAALAHAGLTGVVRLRHGPVECIADHLDGAVILANVPAPVHAAVHACMRACMQPVGVVCSGLRPAEAARVGAGYRTGRLRPVAVTRRGGWECRGLV